MNPTPGQTTRPLPGTGSSVEGGTHSKVLAVGSLPH